MLPTLVAISGILAAAPNAPAGLGPVAVEISFVTHAGEGAAGHKRITRDGCFQSESGGSTGGSGYARDSNAGCHRPADVAPIFARLDGVAASALVRESAGPPKGDAAGGARAGGLSPGGSETTVVLIRPDGSRWVAANQATADDILRAVNELPSENQWYATAPEKPVGAGAQLVVVATASGRGAGWRYEGSLASDGRWWCHKSVIAPHGSESRLPAKRAAPVTNAPARLARILAGAHADAHDDAQPANDPRGPENSVEVAWPGAARAALRPAKLTGTVIQRFVGELRAQSPTCDVR